MKTFLKALSLLAFGALATLSPAADFPEGSPKFVSSLSQALEKSKIEHKPIIAIFSAAWCGPCQVMKKQVYPSIEVQPYHDQFIWAYIDTDEEKNAADADKYKVSGIPHVAFIAENGKSLKKQVGAVSSEEFVSTLDAVLKKAAKSKPAK